MLIKHTKAHAYCVNHVRTEVLVDEVTDWPESVSRTAIDRYEAEEVDPESVVESDDDDSGSDGEDTDNGGSVDGNSNKSGPSSDLDDDTTKKTEATVVEFSKSTMKAINKSGKSIDELKAMSRENMIALPGIGEKSADEILNNG
jgi:hypothetical protein